MKRSIHLQTWRGLLFAEVILLLLFAIFSIAMAGEITGVVRNLKGEPVDDAVVHILSVPEEKSQQSPKTEIMKQDKCEFVPHILPVVVGTPVIFSNEEQMRHHIYSKYPVMPPFRHMFYTKGQTEQEVFDKEGIIELGCQIHKTMSAFVLVLQNPHFAITDEQGTYTIKNIPAGKYKLVVWHEFLPIKPIKTAKNIKVPTSGQVAVDFNYDLKMEHPKWKKPVPLKTEVGTGIADAKWNGSEANPQRFTSTDSYVVAVGTAERPEVVKAVKIEKALSADKEVRLFRVKIEGKFSFHSKEIRQDVYFTNTNFSGETDFYGVTFSGVTDFRGATFSGVADFGETTFSKGADFGRARFSQTDFGIVQFLGTADFSNTTFLGAADFSSATFSEKADFSEARFKDLSDFSNCLYPETAPIDFSGVSNFSQMTIEWKYDSQGHTEDNQNKERRELNGHLVYDETFYLALIKNYQEMNWFSQADDCYYTYKKEKRKRQNFWRRQVELIFLDVPFGYGVKPWKLLRSFLVVWILFGIYYRRFLRLKEDRSSYPSSTRYNAYAFVWSFAHSLNLLTPGVDFHSLTDPYMKKEQNPYQFSEGSQAVIWAQRLQQILGLYLLVLLLILLTRA